jgi:hypothetical protein
VIAERYVWDEIFFFGAPSFRVLDKMMINTDTWKSLQVLSPFQVRNYSPLFKTVGYGQTTFEGTTIYFRI